MGWFLDPYGCHRHMNVVAGTMWGAFFGWSCHDHAWGTAFVSMVFVVANASALAGKLNEVRRWYDQE